MKTALLARPDHSVGLYKGLLKRNIDVDYVTFYAARERSVLNKILPKRKTVPATARTLDTFTLVAYLSNKLGRKVGYNWRKVESGLANYFYSKINLSNVSLIHYWPFYTSKLIQDIKEKYPHISTIAEYYESEPDFINKLFDIEYEKFGITKKNRINKLINQNEAFQFEYNFFVPSEFTANTYKVKYPNKNLFVVNYGVSGCDLNVTALENSHIRNKNLRCIYVGQVCVEKGVHYLLDASIKTGSAIDIIGEVRKNQEHVFSKYSNNSSIRFLGGLSNYEVKQSLSQYDLFILPSLSDSYSIATCEALSQGLPVIVTENCGIKNDIIENKLGYVCPIADSDRIAETIQSFSKNFDYGTFKNGVYEFFAKDTYIENVLDVYEKLVSR